MAAKYKPDTEATIDYESYRKSQQSLSIAMVHATKLLANAHHKRDEYMTEDDVFECITDMIAVLAAGLNIQTES